MIVDIEKFLKMEDNRYRFTKASMLAVDKIVASRVFPELANVWKIVPNVLNYMLNNEIKYQHNEKEETNIESKRSKQRKASPRPAASSGSNKPRRPRKPQ